MEFINTDPDYTRFWDIRHPETLATLELAPGESVELDPATLPVDFNDPYLKPVDPEAFEELVAERRAAAHDLILDGHDPEEDDETSEPDSQGATDPVDDSATPKE
jgi:hypothetical protein